MRLGAWRRRAGAAALLAACAVMPTGCAAPGAPGPRPAVPDLRDPPEPSGPLPAALAPLVTDGDIDPVGSELVTGPDGGAASRFRPRAGLGQVIDEPDGGPLEGKQTWFYPVRHVNAAELKTLLDPWKPDRIQVYEHLNMLVITAAPGQLAHLGAVLEEIDRVPQQVEIEAKIIELRRSYGFEFGFELRVDRAPASNSALRDFSSRFQSTSFIESVRGNTAFQGAEMRWASVGRVVEELGDFEYLIHALENEGFAEVLSSPRVVVHPGHEATLEAVTEVPIQVTNIQGNAVFITTTFKSVGVKLHVKVNSVGSRALQLNMKPEVSSVVTLIQPQGQAGALAVPVIATRSAHTEVDVRDGEMLVVGGLFEKQSRDDQTGVPILSQVPVLGHFLGARDEEASQTEIIFMLKVRILDETTKARALLRVPLPTAEEGAPPQPR